MIADLVAILVTMSIAGNVVMIAALRNEWRAHRETIDRLAAAHEADLSERCKAARDIMRGALDQQARRTIEACSHARRQRFLTDMMSSDN